MSDTKVETENNRKDKNEIEETKKGFVISFKNLFKKISKKKIKAVKKSE